MENHVLFMKWGIDSTLNFSPDIYWSFCNSNVTLHMYKWVKTPDEFCDYFCRQTLTVHEQASHSKHKNHAAYMTIAGGKDIADFIIQVSTSCIWLELHSNWIL